MNEAMRLRQIDSCFRLRLVGAIAFGGTIIELLAAKYYERAAQRNRFAQCGRGLIALAAAWRFPRRVTERAPQGTMADIEAGSLLGVSPHLWGNLEFGRETSPDAGDGSHMSSPFSGHNPPDASTILMSGAALASLAAAATAARARDQALVPVPAGARPQPAALAGRRYARQPRRTQAGGTAWPPPPASIAPLTNFA